MHVLYICAEDGERMELVQGKFGLFYRCPCYVYPDVAKSTGRKPCYGRLSLGAAELIEGIVEGLERDGRFGVEEKIRLQRCDVCLIWRSKGLCEAHIRRTVRKGGQRHGRQQSYYDI